MFMPVCKDENAEKERRRKIGEAVRNAAIRRRRAAGRSIGPFKCNVCGKPVSTESCRCHSCATTALRAREKKNKDKICEVCGKPSGRKVCRSCAAKKCSDTWKVKIEARRDKEPPEICEVCGEAVWDGCCRHCAGRVSVQHMNEKMKILRVEKRKTCSVCGKKTSRDPCQSCTIKSPEVQKKYKKHWADPAWRKMFFKASRRGRLKKRPTSIEVTVAEILDKMGIEYQREYNIGRKYYDFYLPSFGTLIEADGTYWHSLPEVIRGDKEKDEIARSAGFRLVRLPGELIRSEMFKDLALMHILPPH